MLAEKSLYWPALAFKAVSTNIDLLGSEQPLENFLLFGRHHLTTKLKSWDFSFPYPTHKCEKLKHELIECLIHATFQALRKHFLHHVFHSSLQECCGEDVADSTNFRKYWYIDWKLKGGKLAVILQSCLHNMRGTNRSVCEMEAMQCLMTVPPFGAKVNGVVR